MGEAERTKNVLDLTGRTQHSGVLEHSRTGVERSWSVDKPALKMTRERERMSWLIKMVAEKGDERANGRVDDERVRALFQKGCFAA